ncbi:hypothetical protein EV679_0717 [Kerstersia gyiorum]|uniref:Transcriptional initiation protein Tat n=1 Tax=Kerstersia gyiorum TaxID=206506 RepID=A0A4Q7MWU4_9BURK|nr:PhoX family phosphatase [Kerstersia gyiorum]KAB0545003.1 PhoX family phosphatase [Kerstersia gyiorum]RZS73521.1 hypothetical protein EV679_0717 [Kerstersia gyiorum]
MNELDLDDIPSNPSKARSFNEVVSIAQARRGFLKTGLGMGAVGFFGSTLAACGSSGDKDDDNHGGGDTDGSTLPKLDAEQIKAFKGIPHNTADAITLPDGYASAVITRWGDPLHVYSPTFKGDASDGGTAQSLQIGYNHDGMHFFPIDGSNSISGSSTEGLLVTNHEYITPHFFFPKGIEPGKAGWNLDWVRKSQHAQGASVKHIRLNGQGNWEMVLDSRYNRSVNATTLMQLVGPAAGSRLAKTNADPEGRYAYGTYGNCGNGHTFWNTYLTCEENFTDYFGVGNKDANAVDYVDAEQKSHLQRYKGSGKTSSSSYKWDTHDSRFDWSAEPNEANRFGWVVEINPFDPSSAPKKLTALGRFKHENAAITLADDKRVVVYMGDDQVSEYIYKFVSSGKYDPATPELNHRLLHEGTLYVAIFDNGDTSGDFAGVGRWIPLTLDTPTLDGKRLGDLFNNDMGELLIKTRQAADAVGATPMDRPEWVAVHPDTREAYVTLTNNSSRGNGKERYPGGPLHPEANDANPRNGNKYGQIVRWREAGGDPANLSFEWDIFVLAGNPNVYPEGDLRAGSANITKDNTFNSPDGLAFDPRGLLWIQTDGSYDNSGDYEGQGNNQMLVADPVSKEIRRFMVGPKGCEVTGVTWTPDMKYLFINIQHPGEGAGVAESQAAPTAISTWPDGAKATRPRPATVVIWRKDGGLVGTFPEAQAQA